MVQGQQMGVPMPLQQQGQMRSFDPGQGVLTMMV